ncbi:MAG: NAD(P)-binding protein, partial [Solirubrobacterales bacterium]
MSTSFNGSANGSTNGAVAANGQAADHVHIAIVGSGFSGLAMAHRLKKAGRSDFAIFEK